MSTPIYGLLLVGGESRRMGTDKALLSYHGEETQMERSVALLNSVCARSFVSMRQEQTFAVPETTETLFDCVDSAKGPLCGILSAMQTHPEAHWLVLACDLPYLDEATLNHLINNFQQAPTQLTAYRSTHDGLPEPLCAIYPQGVDQELLALSFEIGKSCPRKLLILKDARLIDQLNPRSLNNINTRDEYDAAIQAG